LQHSLIIYYKEKQMATDTALRPIPHDAAVAAHAAAPAAPDADRNVRHSDDPQADKVSRAADIALTAATILTTYYVDPVAPVVGAAFAAFFGDKEVIILSGQPKLASLFTSPYVKATCTAASILFLPTFTATAACSLGFLMCCRLQRTKREPAPAVAAAAPQPDKHRKKAE
jgi:hypothetical protein